MTYLYIKEHNVTGLRYFGKTVRDPNKYHGSGSYWKKHIAKHGKDIKTVWTKQFDDLVECEEFALAFSDLFDIVESSEWANLIAEDSKGGGMPPGRPSALKGRKRPEHADKMRVAMLGECNGMFGKEPWNKGLVGLQTGPNPLKGHPGNQFGKGNLGKIQDAEWRRKKSEAAKANWIKRKAQKEQQ
jgi:hypothetical protein